MPVGGLDLKDRRLRTVAADLTTKSRINAPTIIQNRSFIAPLEEVYRIISANPFSIPCIAQAAHGTVKNLKPFCTKKLGSIAGGMKYIPGTTP
tara:strand:+ start:261 stop:539 length:279 start_codon:yes stop_codon:yes gene_type:complete